MKKSTILITAIAALSLLTVSLPVFGQKAEKWRIVVSKSRLEDEAMKVAIEDLGKTGKELGITIKVVSDSTEFPGNTIVVGDSTRNEATAALVKQGRIKLEGVDDEQGYEIRTITTDGGRIIVVAGGSVIGDVYGLYWIWDRMRVFKEIPDIDVKRVPALKIRLILAWGRRGAGSSKEGIKNALRYSANWISGNSIPDLVPWSAEPEQTENKKNRERTKKLIEYAHSLHIKYFAFGNEFAYHPSLLKEFGATLSPCDPAFWDAVQAKYRRLLRALPELDGVKICLSEVSSGVWENYKAFDVIDDGEGCDWSLEKRYRTFIKKIYNVVAGEFDKTYYHFTWETNSYEQHSQSDVYRKTFTEDIPVSNLYLVPKITQNDRWWYQAYNPTFNVTAHNTIVGFETMDYHAGSNVFPTFPGQYFQAGLQTIMAPSTNNLKGAGFLGISPSSGWDTRNITAYTVFRLAWEPREEVGKIAEDFASIHFGRVAADKMADILLLSPAAYKYGLYIEPAAYGAFNSFPHIRVGKFIEQGYPHIDNGREHIEFLQKIYLRCKPWMSETLLYLDHGLDVANTMVEKYQTVEPLVDDPKLAQDTKNSLELTRLLIKTNNFYVKTFFSYFEYRDTPTVENKNKLFELSSELKDTKEKFIRTPGYGYQLSGVEQLLKNVEQALDDLPRAEESLAKAPGPAEIKQLIAEQQRKYEKVLKEYSEEAVKFLHWQGRVDGRDLLKIKGDNLAVKHIRWDGIRDMTYSFLESLPKKAVTVIPVDIESKLIHPFIMEQPTEENNYTVEVYLHDIPGGANWWKFDLYYISKTPEELELKAPWEK